MGRIIVEGKDKDIVMRFLKNGSDGKMERDRTQSMCERSDL